MSSEEETLRKKKKEKRRKKKKKVKEGISVFSSAVDLRFVKETLLVVVGIDH